MSIVFLVAPCFSHVDCLFVLSFIVYVMSYAHVVFSLSWLVVLSLRHVTGEIWHGVNCYPNVLPIAMQFAHFVLSFVVYCC